MKDRPGLALTAEIGPKRTEDAPSLKEYWRNSGGKWTKLKRLITKHRGYRCEICGATDGQLNAHETWNYFNAADTGMDPEDIRQALNQRRLLEMRLNIEPLSENPMLRALVDIRLLCRACHVCKHSYDRRYMQHWCAVNARTTRQFHQHYRAALERWKGTLVIASGFSGFDELPNFQSFKEWQEALEDEASAWFEDDWMYIENEMNDSFPIFGGKWDYK